MKPSGHPLSPPSPQERRSRVDFSPDWILAGVLIVGLVVMLTAISGGSSADQTATGPRMAVGMTPTDGAITMRLATCGSESISLVALQAVEQDLTLWEAVAVDPDSRTVFVVGQAPTTFIETVPLIEELPRGALLEARIETEEMHSVQFLFADLLPDLWSYEGNYYPEAVIGTAIEDGSGCGAVIDETTSGRRVLMLIGFLTAAAAGAGLVARRMVESGR